MCPEPAWAEYSETGPRAIRAAAGRARCPARPVSTPSPYDQRIPIADSCSIRSGVSVVALLR
ncbi:hypothetical protein GCM10010372_83780 [Streptomyces tauricus]|nr:hypothetical protein GCM10010372_83780 [Streptomyces tauricus]